MRSERPAPDEAGPSYAPSAELRQGGRYRYLDGLRGAASLLVVVHHGFTLLDFAIYSGNASDSHFSWDVWLSRMPFVIVNSGNFAVCIFFVLSGFVLAHSFSKTDFSILALVAKRYVRLTIPILAANIFAFIVLSSLTRQPLPGALSIGRSFYDIVYAFKYCLYEAFVMATLTGLQGGTYNGVLWTMYIEFWGSMILILSFVWGRISSRLYNDRTVCTAIFLSVFTLLTWNSYFVLFGLGAILNLVVKGGRPPVGRLHNWGCAILIAVAFLLGTLPDGRFHLQLYDPLLFLFGGTFESMAALSVYHPLLRLSGYPDWVVAPFGPFDIWHGVGAFILVAALCRSGPLQRLLSARFFQWLGRISFPLYLVHATVRETCARWLLQAGLLSGLGYGAAAVLALVGYVAVALVIATGFTALFEQRSTTWAAWTADWIEARYRGIWRIPVTD